MKDTKKLIRHEIAICDKLYAEYGDAWLDAVGKGDEVGARVYNDLRTLIHGEKRGLKIALDYIEGARDEK